MLGQNLLPLACPLREFTRERSLNLNVRNLSMENPIKDASHRAGVALIFSFKTFRGWEGQQPGQTFPGGPIRRNRVGLAILLHLESMFDIAEKTVSGGQLLRVLRPKELILRKLLETGQRLRALQKRLPPCVEQLQYLGYEFDFPDAAPSQFYIPVQLPGPDHLVL